MSLSSHDTFSESSRRSAAHDQVDLYMIQYVPGQVDSQDVLCCLLMGEDPAERPTGLSSSCHPPV